jgi:serine protease Do
VSSANSGEAAEKLRRSTVLVRTAAVHQGTGVLWNDRGWIITNAHVAAADAVQVEYWNGDTVPAKVLRRDMRRDLVLLDTAHTGAAQTGAPASAPQWTDSSRLRAGDRVMAIGNPLGFVGALSFGEVERVAPIPQISSLPWIQARIRLAPGNSGGAMADSDGLVAGINTMVAGHLGLAIPANDVAAFVAKARTHGGTPALGVAVETLPIRLGKQPAVGLRIQQISPGSKAEFASLRPGDVIIGVDGEFLQSPQDLPDRLEKGGVMQLEFLRGNRPVPREVSIALGRLPNAA